MATYSAMLPEAPPFSAQFVADCRTSGDYSPMLFEWYKFVGSLAALVAHIQRESPAYKTIARREFHFLIGLLNRCARLMLSNVALSHEGNFGETTAIIDRCIFESAIKALWLMQEPSDERFDRYFADGLRTELEFKGHIETNIAERGEIFPSKRKCFARLKTPSWHLR